MRQLTGKCNYSSSRFHKWGAIALVLLVAALGCAYGQSGGSKDTKKLRDKVDAARESIQDTENEIKSTMALYNELVEQKAKKPDTTYKKLSKGVDSCDSAAKNARKSVDSMKKDLEKFYTAWQKEVAEYTSESMKKQSQDSLDAVKAKYQRFDDSLAEASELYKPFIASLRDQVLYLGRDLSPEAISSLGSHAEELNSNASELYTKIDAVLNDTKAADGATDDAGADQGGSEADPDEAKKDS